MGPGLIADRMADALDRHPDCRLVAVASKTPEKAERFAAEHGAVQAMSYEELAVSGEIDVIYVATTHNFHYENARLALEHGKHAVVEKSFTVNTSQARELAELAREKDLFLMEAIWTRFLPVSRRMKAELANGIIGELKLIDIAFGNFVPPEYRERLTNPALAGGTLLDMGIYPISFVCQMTGEIPSEIHSFARFSDTGVDEVDSFQFRFPSGCLATVNTSHNLKLRTEATLYGSDGYIHYPGFKDGNSFKVHRHDGTRNVVKSTTIVEKKQENDFVYQLDEVVNCLCAGKRESSVIPVAESVAIMEVMDRMREQWGFRYPFES